MIPAAERAEGFHELRGAESCAGEPLVRVAFPRMFEVEAQLAPAVELRLATQQTGGEERHAAADVAADEIRMDDAAGDEGRTDRPALARVQIRQPNGESDAGQARSGAELAHRFAFDPVP